MYFLSELTDTKTRLHALEEENSRYQSLIRSSKKAGELELLIRDNGYLRNKLKDQEEDFRLQNNTLLKELTKARRVFFLSLEAQNVSNGFKF